MKIIPVVLILLIMLTMTSSVSAQGEKDLRTIFESGMMSYQRGEYAQAIKEFEEVIDINPNFAPVYNYLGLAHQANGDPSDDVIWFFKVALDIDPEYAEAYHNICRVHYQDGKHLEAEKTCRKALSIDPDLGPAQLSLAWIYLIGKEQPEMAIPFFRQVLEKIENPMVYFGLGMAYAQNGDRGQVLEVVTKLRSAGENTLAVQLEDIIRQQEEPIYPEENGDFAIPQRQAGQIVGAMRAPETQTDTGVDSSLGTTSTMRIRLKGQLMTQPSDEETMLPLEPEHPGSLSEE